MLLPSYVIAFLSIEKNFNNCKEIQWYRNVHFFNSCIDFLTQGTSDGQIVAVDDIKIKGDEFWDYDQQVDLEAFSTKDFYSTLSKQSSDVTSALAKQKDQVRIMDKGIFD